MKRYIKLFIVPVLCFAVFLSYNNVNAKEIYYSNDNGVSLSKEEYDFFSMLYWDGYQEYLTTEKYEIFVANDFLNAEYDSSTTQEKNNIKIGDVSSAQGTYHSTNSKSISISKICDTTCIIITKVNWFGTPSVKSYDVIGAYLYGATRIGTPSTLASSNSNTTSTAYYKYDSNGFGGSFVVPSGSGLVITQDFITTTSGHIYASYQHATKTSSLAISQSYNISLTGFGGVFGFYGSAYNTYDDMNGVDIIL